MRLPGHSGCKFNFNDEEKLVLKSTNGNYPKGRFLRQVVKQKQFHHDMLHDPFYDTPYIYMASENGEEACMLMELVDGYDWIEFLSIASEADFQQATNLVTSLLWRQWGKSYTRIISKNRFFMKYCDVHSKLSPFLKMRLYEYEKRYMPDRDVVVPVGTCHGDFTLSNMMINKGSPPAKLILFDFMETYLDSPMQDIAKLRQDTRHHWTLSRYPGAVNEAKVVKRLTQMDEIIANLFHTGMEEYSYELFQFMNLIRILPYAKEHKTVQYVFEQLERIT